jgi:hypothetical protein
VLPGAPRQAPTGFPARLSAGMVYYSCSSLLVYLPASGGRGIRTPDLISAIDALSRLSYAPKHGKPCEVLETTIAEGAAHVKPRFRRVS